jgi:hypothetical protein
LLRSKKVLALLRRHRRPAPVGEHLHRALHRGPRGDAVAPALHVRILLDVHVLALGKPQPGHDRHVGDGVFVAGDELRLREAPLEHAVKAVGLVAIAVHRVLDLLRRVLQEVVRLPEHRPDVPHLEHHPLHHLPALADVLGQELAGLRGEVEEDRPRFGERHGLAARTVGVHHRRHLVVGRDLEEFGLELVAHADIHRDHPVGQAGFLQHDVDLVPVGRRPGVQVDHSSLTRV